MKLNLPKPKSAPPTVKAVKGRVLSPARPGLADNFGDIYSQAKVAEKAAGEQAEYARTRIIALAREKGSYKGNNRVVTGHRYEVGYTEVPGKATVDTAKLKKLVPASQLVGILSTVTVEQFDENMFSAAVNSGAISQAVAKAVIRPGKGSERIVVKAL